MVTFHSQPRGGGWSGQDCCDPLGPSPVPRKTANAASCPQTTASGILPGCTHGYCTLREAEGNRFVNPRVRDLLEPLRPKPRAPSTFGAYHTSGPSKNNPEGHHTSLRLFRNTDTPRPETGQLVAVVGQPLSAKRQPLAPLVGCQSGRFLGPLKCGRPGLFLFFLGPPKERPDDHQERDVTWSCAHCRRKEVQSAHILRVAGPVSGVSVCPITCVRRSQTVHVSGYKASGGAGGQEGCRSTRILMPHRPPETVLILVKIP